MRPHDGARAAGVNRARAKNATGGMLGAGRRRQYPCGMSVIAHGVDLVRCPRIAAVWKRHGDAFLHRVFGREELAYCLSRRDPVPHLSARFAAKEAVFKALGTGWRGGLKWTDIQTLPDALGSPTLLLSDQTAALAARLGVVRWLVSLSHSGDYAIASVLGLAGPDDPAAYSPDAR